MKKPLSLGLCFLGLWVTGCKPAPTSGPAPVQRTDANPIVATSDRKGLDLVLALPRSVYRIDQDIEATIVIENHEPLYWAIFPAFAPRGQSPANHPDVELSFSITDESGVEVPYSGFYEGLRETPSVHAIFPLLPKCFYGQRISLKSGEFAYRIQQPGSYRIRANLRHFARQWVKNALARETRAPDVIYETARVFDGNLQSNEVRIRVESK